jgi:deoxyadenosine/deoxycytidine kinase
MMAYISRLALLKKTAKENPDAIIITERSLDTDKYVFAKMLFDDGKIEDVNYAIYLKWFDHFIEDLPLEGVIYLKTDAEICSQRIRQRNRDGEETIPIEYLKKCGYYHNQMMFQKSGTLQITLNGNENIKYKLEEWISIVENYIQRL